MNMDNGRFLARKLKDVTTVRAEDLSSPYPVPRLVEEKAAEVAVGPARCQVICVASGKGGTGKSVITTNLAVALVREGLRVLVFDADMGLANAHLLLGVTPERDISDVFDGSMGLRDVVVDCPSGVKLICGASGFSELADLAMPQFRHLAFGLKDLEVDNDIILVDLSAGISSQVVRFLSAAHDVLLVTNPDVTALLDAYATIKVLAEVSGSAKVRLIVNRARDRDDAIAAFKKIQDVAARRLADVEISFFGWVPQNWYIQDSVSKRMPAVICHPKSFVTSCLKAMAERIKLFHLDWKRASLQDDTVHHPIAPFSHRLGQTILK